MLNWKIRKELKSISEWGSIGFVGFVIGDTIFGFQAGLSSPLLLVSVVIIGSLVVMGSLLNILERWDGGEE